MVGYKLSKNDWVTPFFVIFRSVRDKLLVTVFCEHPVAMLTRLQGNILIKRGAVITNISRLPGGEAGNK